MPIFEYVCAECNHGFEVMRVSRNGFRNIRCPKCDGKKVAKQLSTFAPAVGASSDALPCNDGSCPMPTTDCASGSCAMMN